MRHLLPFAPDSTHSCGFAEGTSWKSLPVHVAWWLYNWWPETACKRSMECWCLFNLTWLQDIFSRWNLFVGKLAGWDSCFGCPGPMFRLLAAPFLNLGGDSCNFAHGEEELRKPGEAYKKAMKECRHKNRCWLMSVLLEEVLWRKYTRILYTCIPYTYVNFLWNPY